MKKNLFLSLFVVLAFFGSLFFYSLVNFNRSDLVLEIRKTDSAAYIERDGDYLKMKTSNSPEGCVSSKVALSFFDKMQLAILMSGNIDEYSSKVPEVEYLLTVKDSARETTYYYSVSNDESVKPNNMVRIVNKLINPWQESLADLGFNKLK